VFVTELVKHSLSATASYRLLTDPVPSSGKIAESVKANGFDSILVTHRLPIERITNVTPAYTSLEPDYVMNENRFMHNEYWPGHYHRSYGYNQYWPNYYTYYSEVEHKGTVEIQKYHCKSINVWTTGTNGRVIWSATSKSLEPETSSADSMEKSRRDVINLVIPDLVRRSIIPAK